MNKWLQDRKQWATGLFYRKDGQKQTLQNKPLIRVSAAVFVTLLIYILFTGPKPLEAPKAPLEFPQNRFVDVASLFSPKKEKVSAEPKPDTTLRLRKLPGLQVIESHQQGNDSNRMTLAKATLTTEGTDGAIEARFLTMMSGQHPLLYPGVRLLGEGRTNGDRLQVKFDQLVTSQGETHKIEAYACDLDDQALGLKGSRSWTKSLKIAAALGLNLLSGAGETINESPSDQKDTNPTRRVVVGSFSKTALEQARGLMSDAKGGSAQVQVPVGTEICLLVATHGS